MEKEKYKTYHQVIINSDIWKKWTKYQEEKIEFDIWESIECDYLSESHWNAFINWLRQNDTK